MHDSDEMNQASLPAPATHERRSLRPALALPRGFSVYESGARRVIERSWFSVLSLLLGLLACFPIPVLIVALHSGVLTEPSWKGWSAALALAVLGMVGSYFLVAVLVNRTFVEVGGGELVVRYASLPFRRLRSWKMDKVRGLSYDCAVGYDASREYLVRATLRGSNGTVRVLGGLQDESHARFYVRQLEQWLGLQPHKSRH